MLSTVIDRMKDPLRPAVRLARFYRDSLGPGPTDERLAKDSTEVWRDLTDQKWKANSHWKDGLATHHRPGHHLPELFDSIGRDHLALFDRLSKVIDGPVSFGKVVEWGCGGGANAVAFGPRANEFVGVDVVSDNLVECERQTRSVCDTPFQRVLIDAEAPEVAVEKIGAATCDLFLCLYVLEAVPSPAYGLRILEIGRELLGDTGVAMVQIKYQNADRTTLPRRRGYKRNMSMMTSYAIDEFWLAAQDLGFRPEVVHLVPRNEFDDRYAYFLLSARP